MDFDLLRRKMVSEQLFQRGISDPRVLEAMGRVRREEFVPGPLLKKTYDDCALPIGCEQTISQPFTVAYMCQEARIEATDTVLEIGTGSGYGAAVLAELAQAVHTVERIDELRGAAIERLAKLGYSNVEIHAGDGSLGLAALAPFDAIVCTAGAEQMPSALQQQLTDGGRLVIPIGPPGSQTMYRLIRSGDNWQVDNLGGFGFVPLVSGEESDD